MRSQSLVVTSRPFTLGDHSPPPTRIVRAFAPGGIGNLGPGLDILGCAVTGLGDTVDARFVEAPGIHLEDAGHPDLPTDPSRNAATIAASEVIRRASAVGDGRWAMGKPIGIAIRVGKGLPLSGGQGGSAASAVAGAVAVNALLGGQLGQLDVLASAFAAERTVSLLASGFSRLRPVSAKEPARGSARNQPKRPRLLRQKRLTRPHRNR